MQYSGSPLVSNPASPLRELTCHMGSNSVTCHPAEVMIPPLPPAEANLVHWLIIASPTLPIKKSSLQGAWSGSADPFLEFYTPCNFSATANARDFKFWRDAKLSWLRHCSKAQPVPKAAYRSSHRDKHNQPFAVRFEPGSSHTANGRAIHVHSVFQETMSLVKHFFDFSVANRKLGVSVAEWLACWTEAQ